MIKALQWFSGVVVFLAIWSGILLSPLPDSYLLKNIILYLPVVVIIILGLFSLGCIVYNVLTFNDCPEEANKLKIQIEEARRELNAAGYQL